MSEESQKKPVSQGTEELLCQPPDVLCARETELVLFEPLLSGLVSSQTQLTLKDTMGGR